jgi:N-acetylglucosamine-6-phosphate deacetylase
MRVERVAAEHVVTEQGVLDDAVLVLDGDRIVKVAGDDRSAGVERLQGWLVPGFVDTHCHGGGGADYATTDVEEARRAAAFHLAQGTTTTYASLVTADLAELERQLATLVPLVEAGALAGIHLEGPYLSPEHPGAHRTDLLRNPDRDSIGRLLEAGRGRIRMVTLAPERPGGRPAIAQLREAGVVVALGHTDADEAALREALDAGASVATHLFNAMRPIHHRAPGPVPVLLTDPRATVELICDGFHLHPDVVRLALAAAGPDRVALVTDAMLAAGAADGDYRLGSLPVRVSAGQARLIVEDGSLGSIAGSTLTMARAFEFVVGLEVGIADAARMASTTPARRHGLDDVGVIAAGRQANLCLVDGSGRLQRVMHGGEWVTR